MGLDWYPMDSYSPGDGDQGDYYDVMYPKPWVGPKGQQKCAACGRFVSKKTGRCSLSLMAYREGSPVGYEHR